MILYTVRRVALALIVAALVMIMLALLVNLVPGNPARIILGTHATPQLIAAVQRDLGLGDPILTQVWDFARGAVHGDFGTDYISQEPVSSEIGTPLANTALLTVASVVLSVVVGVPLGVISAMRQGGFVDAMIRGTSMLLVSVPIYVIDLLLLLLFAVKLHLIPAFGAGSLADPGDYLLRLIMPAIALAMFWWGYLARLVRSSVLEVLGQPYVRTARAFGMKERVITYRVILKNALVPVLALLGMMMGYTLSGTVYVEIIFVRSGLGSVSVSALGQRDWPVVRAAVLIYAIGFILGNLLSDIAYRWLDPRLRLEERAEVFL